MFSSLTGLFFISSLFTGNSSEKLTEQQKIAHLKRNSFLKQAAIAIPTSVCSGFIFSELAEYVNNQIPHNMNQHDFKKLCLLGSTLGTLSVNYVVQRNIIDRPAERFSLVADMVGTVVGCIIIGGVCWYYDIKR
ncbi:MAG: hypothetical protein WA432_04880 [Candidatus Babeliaceae bacterium]